MKLNQERIAQLSKGEVAIDYSSEKGLELLEKILKEAFPQDSSGALGNHLFYELLYEGRWNYGNSVPCIPAHPLSWFLSTPYIEPVKEERKTFKVRVTKSNEPTSWVNEAIGGEFEVYEDCHFENTVYHLLVDEGKTPRRFLKPSDCELIPPSSPIGQEGEKEVNPFDFLSVLEENYKAAQDRVTELFREMKSAEAIATEYEDLIAIYKKHSPSGTTRQVVLTKAQRAFLDMNTPLGFNK